jgi:hypothetical protein
MAAITVLHTNDFHNKLTVQQAERIRRLKQESENPILLDCGDAIWSGNIFFRPGGGEACTLVGVKHVGDDRGADIWSDTTTLFVRVYRGVVTPDLDDSAQVRGAGIIRIEPLDFLRQLTTFRADGPSLGDRAGALGRFGMLFFGKLWDVYGRQLVEPGPL